MKKMIHIAAVSGLAVLLSACAGPGTQAVKEAVSEALVDDSGPGGLNPVQRAVSEALVDSGPGGLKPVVEQAVQDTLSKPGPGGVHQALLDALKPDEKGNVDKAVQDALELALGSLGGDDFIRSETFVFDLSGVGDARAAARIEGKLNSIFTEAQGKAKPGLTVSKLEKYTDAPHGSPYYGKPMVYKAVVENLAGLTREDTGFIDREIRTQIAEIPGLSVNEGEGAKKTYAPIRKDPQPPVAVIPKNNASLYTAVAASGKAKLTCSDVTIYKHQIYSAKEVEGRNVVLHIHDGGEGPSVERIGPEYDSEVPIYPVDEKGKEVNVNDGEKAVRCEIGKPKAKYHYIMAKLEDPTVVQYHILDVVNNIPEHIPDEYTEEKPACPPEGWPGSVQRDFMSKAKLTEPDCPHLRL